MKSRSEVLAEKKSSKPSAAERTKDMFEEKEEKETSASTSGDAVVSITCPGCEEAIPLDKLEKTKKGYECPHCAQPIDPASKVKIEKVVKEDKGAKKPEAYTARSGSFCGTCGAEWPAHPDGSFVINCGHGKALRVDDPRKATNMKSTTASGVTSPPDNPVEKKGFPLDVRTTAKIEGNRLTIGWPKIKLPVGEEKGFKYSDMELPANFISVELPPDVDRVAEARKILAELQQIADLTFDVTYKWYCQKLNLVTKD